MKITPDKILFFDLDGTLVDTDYANWISYREVIRNTLSEEDFKKLNFLFEENFNCRITASTIYNYLAEEKANEIISKKQAFYSARPFYTKKIEENISILKRFSQTNKIILVSNAKKSRGLKTLKYHKLDSYFHQMFFKEDQTLNNNKYENAIKVLGINPKNVIAFEDNEEEIQKAKNTGIEHINIVERENIKEVLDRIFQEPTNSILIFQDNDKVEINDEWDSLIFKDNDKRIRIEIDNDTLREILENKENRNIYTEESEYKYFEIKNKENAYAKGKNYRILKYGIKEFTIESNHFLKQNIRSFYHQFYFSGVNWKIQGTIEFLIWSLKNDEGCWIHHKLYLSTACKRLKNILLNDLPEIKNRIGIDNLTICVVPRAKEGFVYREDQLLFRQIVSEVINELNGFEDGTKYIVRHTTTRTTHLNKKYHKIEGKSTYVGITKDTCYISDNVIGKNILLIDDIYTKTANIDEDAIQTLLDKGANNVWFYSVGKTFSLSYSSSLPL